MQSNAIMRYIARKHNMCKYCNYISMPEYNLLQSHTFFMCSVNWDLVTGGVTEDEKVRVDIMENQAMDFRNGFVMMCYTDVVSI